MAICIFQYCFSRVNYDRQIYFLRLMILTDISLIIIVVNHYSTNDVRLISESNSIILQDGK